MSDLTDRIDTLSAKRRKLLALLLEREQAQAAQPGATPSQQTPESPKDAIPATGALDAPGSDIHAEQRARTAHFYNEVNRQLNATIFGEHAAFLNYGYVADGNPHFARFEPPQNQLNRHSMRLVLEVVGDCAIDGCDILDVSCGRGGPIDTISTYFRPREIVGLDISGQAILFCRQTYRYEHISFIEGDAERLPFPDQRFDIILNIEASQNYPDRFRFYREVVRVLRPGGYFLYADLFDKQALRENVRYLHDLGLLVEREQDVTRNVLLACQSAAEKNLRVFQPGSQEEVMKQFLAMPGSEPYERMQGGLSTFSILKLRKHAP